jgi:site-specific DNA-methyltransferase (adenine-specific)
MLAHIIRASTRPGDLILDCFAGSGALGEAAIKLGRKVILIERDPHWFDRCCARLEAASAMPDLFIEPPKKAEQLGLM